jgi:hypothetical protein
VSGELQISTKASMPAARGTPLQTGVLQRACACGNHTLAGGECEACRNKREGTLQRAAINSPPVGEAPPIVHEALRSPGQPLDAATRAFMEPRFGHDFSQVRVHTDARAAESARAVGALAYSVGRDVVFGARQYASTRPSSTYLLAHELAHVTQARAAGEPSSVQARPDSSSAGLAPVWRISANPLTERQADRMAQMVMLGAPVSEKPIPASAIHLYPDERPTEPPPPAQPAAAAAAPPEPGAMANRLVEWYNAGLLAPPFRPADVPEIPPLPVRSEQAGSMGLTPIIAGAAPLLAPGPTAPVAPPAAPPVRLVPPLPSGPVPRPAPPVAGPLRWLGPIGVGIIILLTPTPTAPPWMDETNPITGEPYSSPEEYEWVGRLTPAQREYLRQLDAARRLEPDPTIENDPAPTELPSPLPQPAPREEEEERGCNSGDIPRRGGNSRHDAYATKVTGSSFDYLVVAPPLLAIAYDGLKVNTRQVWEVKVGYGWFFNPAMQSIRDRKLAEFDAQKNLGLSVASACRYTHLWSIPDPWVAGLLNARWGGLPPVLSIPE